MVPQCQLFDFVSAGNGWDVGLAARSDEELIVGQDGLVLEEDLFVEVVDTHH